MKLCEIVKVVSQEVPGVDLSKFQFTIVKETYLNDFSIEFGKNGDFHAFKIVLKDGRKSIGFMLCDEITDLRLSKKVLMIKRTWCNRNFRRKGIISNLYRFVYKELGYSLISDVEQSPESIALWDKLRDSWNVKMIDMNTGKISPINSTEIYHDISKALIIESGDIVKFDIFEDHRFAMDEN